MDKKKKLLFVIPYLHCGGAERVVANISMGLSDEYDIDILVNSSNNVDYAYSGQLISLGIDRFKKVDSVLFQVMALVKRTIKLIQLKKAGQYAVCVSHLDSAHISNILSGNRYCKTVLTAHSTMSENQKNWKYKLFIVPAVKWLYSKADVVVAVSKGIAVDFINNFRLSREKIVTIYNGINLEEIEQQKTEELGAETQQFIAGGRVFCNVGRLDYPKAQWHLIRAFKKVHSNCKDARLLIVGDGDYRSYLETIIRGSNLEEVVKLVGFQTNPFKFLANSDIFVFPSMFEGFPNSPVEALALGLPVITTDFHNGAREILTPETSVETDWIKEIEVTDYGYMVPLCDGRKYSAGDELTHEEGLLAEAMLKTIMDVDNEKYSSDYHERAKERAQFFSLDSMVEGWKKLINEI